MNIPSPKPGFNPGRMPTPPACIFRSIPEDPPPSELHHIPATPIVDRSASFVSAPIHPDTNNTEKSFSLRMVFDQLFGKDSCLNNDQKLENWRVFLQDTRKQEEDSFTDFGAPEQKAILIIILQMAFDGYCQEKDFYIFIRQYIRVGGSIHDAVLAGNKTIAATLLNQGKIITFLRIIKLKQCHLRDVFYKVNGRSVLDCIVEKELKMKQEQYMCSEERKIAKLLKNRIDQCATLGLPGFPFGMVQKSTRDLNCSYLGFFVIRKNAQKVDAFFKERPNVYYCMKSHNPDLCDTGQLVYSNGYLEKRNYFEMLIGKRSIHLQDFVSVIKFKKKQQIKIKAQQNRGGAGAIKSCRNIPMQDCTPGAQGL